MASSGSSDYSVTRNQLCEQAARKIGAVRAGVTMSALLLADFAAALNAMVKHWQADGLHVWTIAEGVLIPQAETRQFALSSASTSAHACLDSDFFVTEISADEASGQTVLSVDDTDDIAVSDKVGVVLDDGTVHFSTVSSKTSTSITIALALTDSAAEGNHVMTYTNRITRPLRITHARLYDLDAQSDLPLGIISRQEYLDLSLKRGNGAVSQIFYDPQLSAGQLYLWQPVAAVTGVIKFTWWRPIEDFDAAGDTPDLPQEWIQTMIFNLAVVMAPEFDVPAEKMSGPHGIGTLADRYLNDMRGWDREMESVFFGVDRRY